MTTFKKMTGSNCLSHEAQQATQSLHPAKDFTSHSSKGRFMTQDKYMFHLFRIGTFHQPNTGSNKIFKSSSHTHSVKQLTLLSLPSPFHSAEFGLRSYLYLLLHGVIAFPASLVFGDGPGKVYTFLAVRLGLALVSALSEAWLAVAASRWMKSRSLGWLTALLLAGSSGTFTSSTCKSFDLFGSLSRSVSLVGGSLLLSGKDSPQGASCGLY